MSLVTALTSLCGPARGSDLAAASFSNDVPGLVLSASVTAPDMVTVTLTNETTSDVDLDQGTVFTKVTKASVS